MAKMMRVTPLRSNKAGDVYTPDTGDPRQQKGDMPSDVSRRRHAYADEDEFVGGTVRTMTVQRKKMPKGKISEKVTLGPKEPLMVRRMSIKEFQEGN